MSAKDDNLIKKIVDAVSRSGQPKTSAYDTTATVTRVEGDTAWVHIPGGVDETPVKLTISAQAGDSVQVRVGGGKAWITGNVTAPPTDDKAAHRAITLASSAMKNVSKAVDVAESAGEMAQEAGNMAVVAMTSADGKSTVYHAASAPTGMAFKVGDTWFNSSEGYAIYTWDGTDWVKEELGEDAIADLSITNAKIANGTIQNAKIGTIDAGKITSGVIDSDRIGANSITIGKLSTSVQSDISDAVSDSADALVAATSANNKAVAYRGTSSTAASTAAKTVTCASYSLTDGASVLVYFTYANTADVPTLNVNSTGAKSIYVNGATASASNPLKWKAGDTVQFTYDGTRYRASLPVEDFITTDGSGIQVHSNSDSSNYLWITSGGVDIYKGGKAIAVYDGSGLTLKQNDTSNTSLAFLGYTQNVGVNLRDLYGGGYFSTTVWRSNESGTGSNRKQCEIQMDSQNKQIILRVYSSSTTSAEAIVDENGNVSPAMGFALLLATNKGVTSTSDALVSQTQANFRNSNLFSLSNSYYIKVLKDGFYRVTVSAVWKSVKDSSKVRSVSLWDATASSNNRKTQAHNRSADFNSASFSEIIALTANHEYRMYARDEGTSGTCTIDNAMICIEPVWVGNTSA